MGCVRAQERTDIDELDVAEQVQGQCQQNADEPYD